MKKTLLAAALLAGFATAGVAQAETSVTLYGILDTGYGYSNFKYSKDGFHGRITHSGMTSGVVNGNRWGVRGSEDLGDGLRAIFTLEAGFDLGTAQGFGLGGRNGGSNMFHRQAFVGLASDNWGTFTMGRQYSPSVTTNVANVGVNMGDMDKAFGGVGFANRMNNSFKYATPNFSGFQAAIAYGTQGDVARYKFQGDEISILNEDRQNWISAGIKYENGPIGVGLSYDRQSVKSKDAITSWNLSGAYDFEVVKVTLAVGQDRHGKLGWDSLGYGAAAGGINEILGANTLPAIDSIKSFKSTNYYLGLSAPLGGGTGAISWSHSRSNLGDSNKLGDAAKKQNIWAANYVYPLSKRTSVYGYASYGTGLSYLSGLKGTEAGIGLNHKF